jgi:hypothetical protein
MNSTRPAWEQTMILGVWRNKINALGLSASTPAIRVGTKVVTTGVGQTRTWKGYHGIVQSIDGDKVRVHFLTVGVQTLNHNEVREQTPRGCSCSQCQWSREHHP